MTLTIHPDLHSLIPPLTADEYQQLEANLLAHGCLDALVIWQEEQTLLDGHNRLQICERHGLTYDVHEISLPDLDAAKAWMLANQLGRRNLTPEQMRYYRGERYNLLKRQGRRTDLTSHHSDGKSQNTAQFLAAQHGVGSATIERDGAYAAAVETLAVVLGPEVRQAILTGPLKTTRQDLRVLAGLASRGAEHVQALKEVLQEADPASHLQAIARSRYCGICERRLTDPASVMRGIGPICAGHGHGTGRAHAGGTATGSPPLPLEPETLEEGETTAPGSAPVGASLSDRDRACMGPRNQKPVGSVAWCWQTIDLLKNRWNRKDFTDQQWEETLAELAQHAVWNVVPPEQPYGSFERLLAAELGLDLTYWLQEAQRGLRSLQTVLETVSIAEPFDAGREGISVMEMCTSLSALYRKVEGALRQAMPAFDAYFGPPPVPTPPAPGGPAPAPAPGAPGTITTQILAVLRGTPGGLTTAELATALGRKRTDTRWGLGRLVKDGRVWKEGAQYLVVDLPGGQD
jgi:hypothetical protein